MKSKPVFIFSILLIICFVFQSCDKAKKDQARSKNEIYMPPKEDAASENSAQGNDLLFFTSPDGMAYIQGGSFLMGSPEDEYGRVFLEIRHLVTVNSFFMGKYEVTQAEYEEVMGTNPSHFKGSSLPVEFVSWFDAIEYCNRRSLKEGLNPAYIISNNENESMRVFDKTATWNRNANGYRLPTEAEWEYACRAGTVTPFNTGNVITSIQANFDDDPDNETPSEYRKKTAPVGSFPANPWGLFDMHGNVWEWCWDWFDAYAQSIPSAKDADDHQFWEMYLDWYDSETDTVKQYPFENDPDHYQRVLRGGSCFQPREQIRSAQRSSSGPNSSYYGYGFRVVRSE